MKRVFQFPQSRKKQKHYLQKPVASGTPIHLLIFIVLSINNMPEIYREYGSVLPCGGKGSRLVSVSEDRVVKSLFKVGGKELIRYSTDTLRHEIVKRLVFAVAYKSD